MDLIEKEEEVTSPFWEKTCRRRSLTKKVVYNLKQVVSGKKIKKKVHCAAVRPSV